MISPSFLKGDDILLTGLALLEEERARNLQEVLDFWTSSAVRLPFVGYLIFDAWIGNTDRHWENWGVILHVKEGKRDERTNRIQASLAPTFDHASSLGVRLSDENRQMRLTTTDRRQTVAAYAARCKTPFSGVVGEKEKRRLSTHDVVAMIVERCPKEAQYWIARLGKIEMRDVEKIFSRVPSSRLSRTSADFALALLNENRQRLICLGGGRK